MTIYNNETEMFEPQPTSDEKLMGMLIYLLSFISGGIIVPLIIWLLKKNESDFVDYHGKEYFNFLISFFIYGLISSVLIFILVGILLLVVLGIVGFVFTIMAAVKAYNGDRWRIPLTIRLIK